MIQNLDVFLWNRKVDTLVAHKAGEVNFREWLVYVLENIHAYDNDYSKDLAELLPHNWKAKNSKKTLNRL